MCRAAERSLIIHGGGQWGLFTTPSPGSLATESEISVPKGLTVNWRSLIRPSSLIDGWFQRWPPGGQSAASGIQSTPFWTVPPQYGITCCTVGAVSGRTCHCVRVVKGYSHGQRPVDVRRVGLPVPVVLYVAGFAVIDVFWVISFWVWRARLPVIERVRTKLSLTDCH